MALLNRTYYTEGNDDTGGFTVIPAGEYIVAMQKNELKKTKAGDGRYLEVRFKVLDGEHAGSALFERFNLINKNKTAENIAVAKFNQLCAAAGVTDVEDADVLLDIPVQAIVAVDPGDSEWPPSNVIKSYRAVTDDDDDDGDDDDEPEAKPKPKAKPKAKGKKGKKDKKGKLPWQA